MKYPILRNSERSDFKKCMWAWNARWNLGLVPANPAQDARYYGTQWHLLWESMYRPPEGKDGFTRADIDPHELWDSLMRDSYMKVSCAPFFDEDKEKTFYDAQELGHHMIDGQIKMWKMDPAFEVIALEQRFKLAIPFNERQKAQGWESWEGLGGIGGMTHITNMTGTLDLIVYDHSSGDPVPVILDWKTTGRSTNLKQLNKDDQAGTYLAVASQALRNEGILKKNEAVERMIFSFARKGKPPENTDENGVVRNMPTISDYRDALNLSDSDIKGMKKEALADIADKAGIKVYGPPSKNQGSPLFWREVAQRNRANRARTITRIADEAELMMGVRSGRLPILKSPSESCSWCDYSDLCDIDENGGDTEIFIRDVFKYDDPYADHRENAENSKKL
jgi:hypothetical protein